MKKLIPIQSLMSGTSIVVNSTGQDNVEREFIFEEVLTSKDISTSLAYELGFQTDKPTIERVKESVEYVKMYTERIEVGLTWEGINFSITRAPQKIIKSFTKKKK